MKHKKKLYLYDIIKKCEKKKHTPPPTYLHVELAFPVARHPDRPGLKVQVETKQRYPPRDVPADEVRHHLGGGGRMNNAKKSTSK